MSNSKLKRYAAIVSLTLGVLLSLGWPKIPFVRQIVESEKNYVTKVLLSLIGISLFWPYWGWLRKKIRDWDDRTKSK